MNGYSPLGIVDRVKRPAGFAAVVASIKHAGLIDYFTIADQRSRTAVRFVIGFYHNLLNSVLLSVVGNLAIKTDRAAMNPYRARVTLGNLYKVGVAGGLVSVSGERDFHFTDTFNSPLAMRLISTRQLGLPAFWLDVARQLNRSAIACKAAVSSLFNRIANGLGCIQ